MPSTLRTFVGYCISGALGVGVYILLLTACTHAGLASFASFTLSYVVAVSAQFMMNRHWNFRAFDRPIYIQAATYAIVTVTNYVFMIAVEEGAIHAFRATNLVAYLLSVPVNVPIGYLANRYLTFGSYGIAMK